MKKIPDKDGIIGTGSPIRIALMALYSKRASPRPAATHAHPAAAMNSSRIITHCLTSATPWWDFTLCITMMCDQHVSCVMQADRGQDGVRGSAEGVLGPGVGPALDSQQGADGIHFWFGVSFVCTYSWKKGLYIVTPK